MQPALTTILDQLLGPSAPPDDARLWALQISMHEGVWNLVSLFDNQDAVAALKLRAAVELICSADPRPTFRFVDCTGRLMVEKERHNRAQGWHTVGASPT